MSTLSHYDAASVNTDIETGADLPENQAGDTLSPAANDSDATTAPDETINAAEVGKDAEPEQGPAANDDAVGAGDEQTVEAETEKAATLTLIAGTPAPWADKAKADAEAAAAAAQAAQFRSIQTAALAYMNGKYAVVHEGGKAFVVESVFDPDQGRHVLNRYKTGDLYTMYRHIRVPVLRGNKVTWIDQGTWWLDHADRKTFLGGIVFDPTEKHDPKCQLNMWRGWGITPQEGDWSLLRDHVFTIVCSGNQAHFDFLMGWMARMFQVPQKPAETAVVMKGDEGVGKGTLAKYLRQLCGQHGVQVARSDDLVGKFNDHLRDAIFIFADEAFFAGDRKNEGVLKAIITEEVRMSQAKFFGSIQVTNRSHIMMASNNDHVIKASRASRRFFVLDVPDTRRGDIAYFDALNKQMKNGGLAAMLYDLLNYDISNFKHTVIPATDALDEQKMHSLEGPDKWLSEVLERGYVYRSRHGAPELGQWHEFCSTELLRRSYEQWSKDTRQGYPMGGAQLGRFLGKFFRGGRPAGDQIVGEVDQPLAGGPTLEMRERPAGYTLGDIESARAKFCEVAGVKMQWVDDHADAADTEEGRLTAALAAANAAEEKSARMQAKLEEMMRDGAYGEAAE